MGLSEGLTKCSDFRAVSSFSLAFSAVSAAATMLLSVLFVGGHRAGLWPVLLPLVLDACSEWSVVVEERVGDTGFPLDGLEFGSRRLIRRAMAESADRVFSSDLRRAAVLRTSMRRWRVSFTRLGSGSWWYRW